MSKLSWPSPSVAELRQAGAAYCAIPWAEMEGYALADGWEPFAGDAEQRKRELPERCRQAAYIDLLLGSVYGVPTEAHNVMVRAQEPTPSLSPSLSLPLSLARSHRCRV